MPEKIRITNIFAYNSSNTHPTNDILEPTPDNLNKDLEDGFQIKDFKVIEYDPPQEHLNQRVATVIWILEKP